MKNKQHLIALDLDGTLLTDDKKISINTRQIIQELQNEGHVFMIATGRSNHASLEYYHLLELMSPIINFNGALTYHPHEKDWGLYHTPLPMTMTREIIEICQELGVANIIAETGNVVYIDQHNQEMIDIFQSVQQYVPEFSVRTGHVKKNLQTSPTSLLIQPKGEQYLEIKEMLAENYKQKVEFRGWGGPWNIFEVTLSGIHKGYALEKVATALDIPQSQVIAFGDQTNDIEMIEYAGVGVAMGNAIDPLKNVADEVTQSNEDDGIKAFLENYF